MHNNKIIQILRPALTSTLSLMLLCGLAYPLFMTFTAQTLFPSQANGSIIYVNNKPIGSSHVGQDFTKDYFMKCRPSAVHYNTYYENTAKEKFYTDNTAFTGLASGSYNYSPSNPALKQRVEKDIENFLAENPTIKREEIPVDLMTASGSGLDPHISLDAAKIQLPAIAKASGLSIKTLQKIVEDNTTLKLFGILGENVVNVLGVNADIANAMKLYK